MEGVCVQSMTPDGTSADGTGGAGCTDTPFKTPAAASQQQDAQANDQGQVDG
jgi:hypothetical protein